MRLSEHELTVAVRAAARTVASARRGLRKGSGDPWERLSRVEQYNLLSSIGDQILPALAALPDLDVPVGQRPAFTAQQLEAAVESQVDPALGRIKRAVALKTRAALLRAAVDGLPPRREADA